VWSSAPPGTLHRLDASNEQLPGDWFGSSTHHFGVHEAVELARALGQLPERVVLVGIEAANVEPGQQLSPEVEAAVDAAVMLVEEEVAACTSVR
jgi:hydrogenase maturation protease